MPDITEVRMIDITKAAVIEIEVSEDLRTLWVNVDGVCLLRATRTESNIQIIGVDSPSESSRG